MDAGRRYEDARTGRALSLQRAWRAKPLLVTRYSLLITILLLAFALRTHLLGAQSFWNDEGSSYVQATRSLADIAYHAGRDIHPPLYYWLLVAWRVLAGESEYALRLLSTFASLLTVALTAALGRRLFGGVGALAAALFVAFNSFNIYYAQEARMYALLALWGVMSLWLLAPMLNRGWNREGAEDAKKRLKHGDTEMTKVHGGKVFSVFLRHLRVSVSKNFSAFSASSRFQQMIALGVVNAVGLYTQYAYIYALLTQAVAVALWLIGRMVAARGAGGHTNVGRAVARPYGTLMGVIGAQVLALALFLPWLPTALTQIGGWPNTGQPVEMAEALNVILNWLIYGVTAQNEALAVAWLLLLFGLVTIGWRADAPLPTDARLRAPTGEASDNARADAINGVPTTEGVGVWRAKPERQALWAAFLPAAWVIVSVGVFMAQGLFREDNLKFLLPAQIGMALWLGRGVAALWSARFVREARAGLWLRRWVVRAAGSAAALLLLVPMINGLNPLYHDPAYQRADYRAIARLAEAEMGAGDVILLNGPNQAEVFNYYYHGDAQVIGLPAGLGGDDAATHAETDALIAQPEVRQVFALLWGDRERDPNGVVESLLDRETFSLSDTWYGDVRLARYLLSDLIGQEELNAHFGESIRLAQAGWTGQGEDALLPGEPVLVRLEWCIDTMLELRHKVFVQLLSSDGVLVAQHDAEPAGNSLPTTIWESETCVVDRHALLIPSDAPPGEYTLIAGMYAVDPPNTRLTLPDGADHVVLARITVR